MSLRGSNIHEDTLAPGVTFARWVIFARVKIVHEVKVKKKLSTKGYG